MGSEANAKAVLAEKAKAKAASKKRNQQVYECGCGNVRATCPLDSHGRLWEESECPCSPPRVCATASGFARSSGDPLNRPSNLQLAFLSRVTGGIGGEPCAASTATVSALLSVPTSCAVSTATVSVSRCLNVPGK